MIENLKSCFLVPGRQQLKASELTLTCKTVVRILKIKFVQKAVISLQTGPRKKEPEWRGEQCYQNLSRLTYRLVSEIHTDGLGKDAQKEATVHEKFKRQKSQEAIKEGRLLFFVFFNHMQPSVICSNQRPNTAVHHRCGLTCDHYCHWSVMRGRCVSANSLEPINTCAGVHTSQGSIVLLRN